MQILIVDLGSQYTLLIGRQLRELGVRSIILPPQKVALWLKRNRPKGIILSGGAASIYDKDAPEVPGAVLSARVPILGICLGMQWIAKKLDGAVKPHHGAKEYGEALLRVRDLGDQIFRGVKKESIVWASHGDSVVKLPRGFQTIGSTAGCRIAAMKSSKKKIWCVQFHPEVNETEYGEQILKNFLTQCAAIPDWRPAGVIRSIRQEFKKYPVGAQFLLGFSGGVDSTTLAAVLKPVLGRRLSCITIDSGNFREGEFMEIKRNARAAGCSLKVIDQKTAFIRALSKTTDAEEKRKIFQKKYRNLFQAVSKNFEYLIQGTLAPDRIESAGTGQAAKIKTHHNVGFSSRMTQLHPFGDLFKYEVRDLARHLRLPSSISERKPFPGPGLFARIVGAPVSRKNLALVRWADIEARKIVVEEKLDNDFAQLVVALLGIRTVGVKGDGRSYGYAIGVRAVQTSDFMTGRGYQFPPEVRRRIQQALTRHKDITRVWFDEGDKPPATVEFE